MTHIEFNSPSTEEVIFSVTDLTGSLIHKEVISDFNGKLQLDYDFDDSANGTYILNILQGDKMYNRKVQLIRE